MKIITQRSKQKQKKAGKAGSAFPAKQATKALPSGWTPQPAAFDSPVGESIFVRRPWSMKSLGGKSVR